MLNVVPEVSEAVIFILFSLLSSALFISTILSSSSIIHSSASSSLPFIISVQFSSVAQLCPTLCNPMNHSTPGLPVHHQLPEFTQTHSIESVMPSSHLILGRPLLLLLPIPPSIRVFSNESTLRLRWPKYHLVTEVISKLGHHHHSTRIQNTD